MTRIYILLLVVMMIWGFNVSALIVLVNHIDPIVLTAVRIFTAGVVVLIICYFMGIFRLPKKHELKIIGIITIFNVVLHHVLLSVGLTMTVGVNAGIILGASPLMTMILAFVILKDHITRLRSIGFLLGFLGIVLTSIIGAGGGFTLSVGDLLIFISMFVQAISFILISKLNPSFDPRLMTGYLLVVGSILIFIVSLIAGNDLRGLGELFSWKLGPVFLFSAIGATAFGHMTYNVAIKQVGPAESAIFINLNTIFSLIGAAIFLGEPILPNHYFGLVFIIIGVFLGSGSLEYVLRERKRT